MRCDSVENIIRTFPKSLFDEAKCRRWFLEVLFPAGPMCPYCGAKISRDRWRERFYSGHINRCSKCGKKFFPFKDTPFHGTNLKYSEIVLIMLLTGLRCDPRDISRTVKRQPVCVKDCQRRLCEALRNQ